MHKFFHFAHLKFTLSTLHTYFYKTPTSVCLLYIFIQIKYSFIYPHSHRPTPTIHTGITLESTQPIGRKPEKQTQQNGSKPTPESTPCLEQQDRRIQWQWRERETRSTPPKASGGDSERHSTSFNSKPTDQAHSTRKQWETKEERVIGSDGDRRRWRSTEARGRKIDERKKDWSNERKKKLCVWERERELRVRYKEEREKTVKKLYAHATVSVHICTGTVATCIYTQVCTG